MQYVVFSTTYMTPDGGGSNPLLESFPKRPPWDGMGRLLAAILERPRLGPDFCLVDLDVLQRTFAKGASNPSSVRR
jgi:hypothetical protein